MNPLVTLNFHFFTTEEGARRGEPYVSENATRHWYHVPRIHDMVTLDEPERMLYGWVRMVDWQDDGTVNVSVDPTGASFD